jgi:hypothetical protein
MENRRNFFKAIGLFVGGAIATKVNGMMPKKQEEKEELMVSEHVVVSDDKGNQYNIVVVPKKERLKEHTSSSFASQERIRITASGNYLPKYVPPAEPEFIVRKLNNQS